DAARILADQELGELDADQLGQRVVVAGAADHRFGLAIADDAACGLDAHQRAVERGDAPEVADVLLRLGDRHVQPVGVDALDLHGLTLPALPILSASASRLQRASTSDRHPRYRCNRTRAR